ncbi:MAG: hypothetical protein ACE5GB_02490 [Acidimicrobiales bacterium]
MAAPRGLPDRAGRPRARCSSYVHGFALQEVDLPFSTTEQTHEVTEEILGLILEGLERSLQGHPGP